MRILNNAFPILFSLVLLSACNSKADFDDFDFLPERLSEIIPLSAGKYITYRVDSTVLTNFGRSVEIHRYQIRHEVDALLTDNLGRPAWRVFRFIRDSMGTGPWVSNGTYFITVLPEQIELTENNMRFVKARVPVRDGNSWKGNKYLAPDPYSPLYNFENDDAIDDWDYFYDGLYQPTEEIQGQTYTDVLTIPHVDETFGDISSPFSVWTRSYSIEKYSKNIGLVYKEYIMLENQPNPIDNPSPPPSIIYDPYQIGFGVRMWMIDHN